MQRRLLLTGALATPFVLAGCASPQITDFAGQKPELDLRRYFNGTLDAYGVFTDRSGKVVRRFDVRTQANALAIPVPPFRTDCAFKVSLLTPLAKK